jgi:hypothetical protein
MLLQMAETWDSLAQDRADQLARQKRIDELSAYIEPRKEIPALRPFPLKVAIE